MSQTPPRSPAPARFVRLAETDRPALALQIDGQAAVALAGDTLLVALLSTVVVGERAHPPSARSATSHSQRTPSGRASSLKS